ncbi:MULTISPECIES: 3-oxoadipate enol-lactonase [Nocardiaceae]|uniref:3-oxoadipate enol-lactonase/4-carboxymuconolactone decarboxylase n=1 Tax=Rhodococcoides corynebacterioides TaxID=53972 RepID=A0ABS2KZR6_9NOCA|nr:MULTISPECIES: 3-oxoadipate enol-lactonase [Rhodococcus]MBM7417434.1 3-oxoadipate enol-lactonase/4-carboxymuconolactone decarboxylase [Rhodococcus corynebacterioides]MBP1115688.1 3-oxoadipate enol-lactonase/4-carboxymuconolactone decarboxylase [Rhodococcus sp. PvP016]
MTVELSYDLVTGRSPQRATIVLVGSLGSDRSMWDAQRSALTEVADVIVVDLRGHGRSPTPNGPYTIADLSEDVLAVLDENGLDRVHLVGLSLGGAVAQWIAVHRPARVQTLTLMCTAARFGEPRGWSDRAAAVRAKGTDSFADAVVSRWFTPEFTARDADLVARHRRMVSATSDEGYASCCEALAGWDDREDLGRISAPTLVIAGEQDPATPPSDARILADGIARSRLHVLTAAAHLANVERAGEVTRLLVDHISRGEYDMGRAAARAEGMRQRRSVLGDAHVDRSIERTTDVTAPFQDFITRTAWGDIWARPGLDHHLRRLLTLAILTAVGNQHELDMHIRAALRAGLSADELAEVFLHTAVYAGVPNSNAAFAMVDRAVTEHDSR